MRIWIPYPNDKLLQRAEQGKCNFEDEDIVNFHINSYGNFGSVNCDIDYDYFSLLIENDIDNACAALEKTIKSSGLNKTALDRILCVGGSSKLRPLQDKLRSIYGEDKLFFPDSVMWDIAKGSAMISERNSCYKLNKPIGLILSDNTFYPLIEKGQEIPSNKTTITLGTVDGDKDSNAEARFVFSDSADPRTAEFTQYFKLPLRGFSDEYIELICYVDEDNVFNAKIGSNRIPESSYGYWNYENLKVCFKLGESKDELKY